MALEMRHLHIFSLLLAICVVLASRLDTKPLLTKEDQKVPATGWLSNIWNRIYDWWYGKPSDCRDMVVWEPGDSSAEEWHPRSGDSSDSGRMTSWSTGTSSGEDTNKKTSKRPLNRSAEDLSKSAYEAFFANGQAEEKPVWKSSLESTAESTKQSLEAPDSTIEDKKLSPENVVKRSDSVEDSDE
jgi:hypothetical protein